MTEQAKQQIADAKTVEDKIKAVNQLLHDGEPGNISIDNYSGYTGLGYQLKELHGKVKRRTIQRIEAYEKQTMKICGLSALDTLFLLHRNGRSLNELSVGVQIALGTLIKIFDRLRIPRLPQKEAAARFNSLLTPEQLSKRGKKSQASLNSKQQEQRSKRGKRALTAFYSSLSPKQRSDMARKAAQRANALLTPEQKSERGKKLFASLTHEQRSTMMKKVWKSYTPERRKLLGRRLRENRLKAEYKPNGIEAIMITLLQELGIYAEDAKSAKLGQAYYADAKGNKWYRRAPDGRLFIPDFKVKGVNAVFEIYGDYWHSRVRCEPLGLPEDTWNSEKKIALYQNMGIVARVYWENELRDPIRREVIKQEIVAVIAKVRAREQNKPKAA